MDESALVGAAQRGDVQAFNRLVLAHQQAAYNVAYRILGDDDKASDATQDAFLRGFRALATFRGGSFKAWVLRIVTNCAYDLMRERQRRPTASIDDLVEDDEHSRVLEDDQETPEAHLERQALDGLIQRGLDLLPEEQRVVVVLSDIEGMNYEEIALATSVSLGTVKSRLSRARAKLREFFITQRELVPDGFRLYGE